MLHETHRTWPRRTLLVAALGAPVLAASARYASPASAQESDGAAAQALVPEAVGPLLDLYPAGALHVVGKERFALGVVDAETGPIEDATIDLLFFAITGNQGTLTETLSPEFFPYGAREHRMEDMEGHETDHDGELTGIYVARPTFDKPGPWGVVARVTMPDGVVRTGQADFTVEAETDVPGPGDTATPSKTAVATTPGEVAAICTADPVDSMHELSLDEAIKNGKPTVVLFATPALCTSRVCGPSLEALQELKSRYGDRANFIHVEIFPERDYETPAAAVEEWRLPSEPWLFLIDSHGTIVERYEGGIGLTELDPAVMQLVENAA